MVGLDDGVGLGVAQALGHPGEALHVAEHEGDHPVGRGVDAQVGALALDRRGDGVDRGLDARRLEALGAELRLETLVELALHFELAAGVQGFTHELEGLLAVARRVALQQDLSVISLGARQPGPRPHPPLDAQRLLEVRNRVLPSLQSCGEQTQRPGRRARAKHHEDGDVAILVREEEIVEGTRPLRVAHCGTGLAG